MSCNVFVLSSSVDIVIAILLPISFFFFFFFTVIQHAVLASTWNIIVVYRHSIHRLHGFSTQRKMMKRKEKKNVSVEYVCLNDDVI